MIVDTEKFWSRVKKTDNCWLWQGYIFKPTGYGGLFVGRTILLAHRISWELHYGPIPKKLQICHHCDVRNCVRPDHLFLGTHAENMKDRNSKKRQAHGERIGKGGKNRQGERNGRAKLTIEQVNAIRQRYSAGNVTQSQLAKEYGVIQPHISRIIKKSQWIGPKDNLTKVAKQRGQTRLPLSERFWSKVQKTDGCWLWLGFIDSRGRPQFSVYNPDLRKSTGRVASRIAYELANNCQLPPNIVVAHTCDNPSCVNPEHLKAMTQSENIRDCHKKGRDRWSRQRNST